MKRTRRLVQFAFVALTLIGVYVVKGNAELYCPFGGVEAIYTYVHEGNMLCSLGVSNFYVLAAVLLTALLLRRAFCGYSCPIGALSEWLQAGATRIGVRPVRVPYRLDRGLALLKYGVLAIILYFTWSAAELEFRKADPCYALISRHGEDITFWAYGVSGAIVVLSLLIVMPFCRWFCPLAAVMHPLSRIGLTRVQRHPDACTQCGRCAKVCPTAIKVDEVEQVTAARCLSCLNCVELCPREKQGALTWGPPKSLGRPWSQAALIGILLLCLTGAVVAAYALPIPSFRAVAADRGPAPETTAVSDLKVNNLTCRGRGSLLMYFMERDDEFAIPGYLGVEAWPGPGYVPVRITYDPARTDEDRIREGITEPYFDGETWRTSPFVIEGYDPLGLSSVGGPDTRAVSETDSWAVTRPTRFSVPGRHEVGTWQGTFRLLSGGLTTRVSRLGQKRVCSTTCDGFFRGF